MIMVIIRWISRKGNAVHFLLNKYFSLYHFEIIYLCPSIFAINAFINKRKQRLQIRTFIILSTVGLFSFTRKALLAQCFSVSGYHVYSLWLSCSRRLLYDIAFQYYFGFEGI
jgi:hypothetical protein